jgi:DNA gyrase subunit A
LARAKERAHILEGLLTALDHLDEVIDTIRRSRTTDSAHNNLRRKFKLSDAQAQAILDMPLKRLAALERKKIQEEYKEKQRIIKRLTALLRSPKKIRGVVRDELAAVKEKYDDPRRTQVVDAGKAKLTADDLIPDDPVWVAVSRGGLVARIPDEGSAPRVPSRPKDVPIAVLAASTRDTLYLCTASGKAVAYPIYQLPEGVAWEGNGSHYADLTPLGRRDDVTAVVAVPPVLEEGYLCLVTQQGSIKRVALADLPGVSGEPFVVMGVEGKDALGWVAITTGQDEVILVTAEGKAIRFDENEVRSMGLPAGGVMGVKLSGAKDRVVDMAVTRSRSDLFVIAEDGRAKRTTLTEYPTQSRYGQGVITARFSADVKLAGACVVQSNDPIVLVTDKGAAKTIRGKSAPRMGRATQGESVIALRGRDIVVDSFVPRASVEIEE